MNRNEYLTFDCAGGIAKTSKKTFNAIPFLKAIAIVVTALTAAAII